MCEVETMMIDAFFSSSVHHSETIPFLCIRNGPYAIGNDNIFVLVSRPDFDMRNFKTTLHATVCISLHCIFAIQAYFVSL
jgi:hypothetical protein